MKDDRNEHFHKIEEELEHFKRERERIRALLGKIGGVGDVRKHKIFNIAILLTTVTLFILEMLHILPIMMSLEIGLLLVSVKIVLLIQSMLRQNHFEFWMLNTIEFRINEISNRMHALETQVRDFTKQLGSQPDEETQD